MGKASNVCEIKHPFLGKLGVRRKVSADGGTDGLFRSSGLSSASCIMKGGVED